MSEYVHFWERKPLADLRALRAAGITGVCRYIDSGRVPLKQVSNEELADLATAGLACHLFFETSGGANNIQGFEGGGASSPSAGRNPVLPSARAMNP